MTIPPPTTVEMMDSATVYMKRGCDYDDYYAHIYGCGFIPEHVGAQFRQLPTTEKTTTVWTWSYPIGFSVPPGFRFSVPSRPRPVSRLRPVKPSEPNTDADEDLVAEILTTEATTNENGRFRQFYKFYLDSRPHGGPRCRNGPFESQK